MQSLKYTIGYLLFIKIVKSQTVDSPVQPALEQTSEQALEKVSEPDNSFKCFCSTIKTDETCQYDSSYGSTVQTCPEQSNCFLESISSNNPKNARNVLYLAGCTQEALETPDCFNLSDEVQDCTATCAKSLCNSPNGINPNTNNTLGFDLARYAAGVVSKDDTPSDATPSGATGNGSGELGKNWNLFLMTVFLYMSANLF